MIINKERCIKCHDCIRVCPFTVLYAVEGYPVMKPEKNCLECMHCVSICAQEALQFENAPTNMISDKLYITEGGDQLLEAYIKTRRSVRNYKKDIVPKEIINRVLDTVEWVPSAKNQHPVKWVVINGKDNIDVIMNLIFKWVEENKISKEIISEYKAGNNIVTCEAPSLLISYGSTSAINAYTDCVIALTSAELLLYSRGISTCWAGYLTRISNACPDILNFMGIPEGSKIFGCLMMGYADKEHYNTIPHRKAADIHWI